MRDGGWGAGSFSGGESGAWGAAERRSFVVAVLVEWQLGNWQPECDPCVVGPARGGSGTDGPVCRAVPPCTLYSHLSDGGTGCPMGWTRWAVAGGAACGLKWRDEQMQQQLAAVSNTDAVHEVAVVVADVAPAQPVAAAADTFLSTPRKASSRPWECQRCTVTTTTCRRSGPGGKSTLCNGMS